MLVFEDLHWIDSETQAFLDSLIESLPDAHGFSCSSITVPNTSMVGAARLTIANAHRPVTAREREEILSALLGRRRRFSRLRSFD